MTASKGCQRGLSLRLSQVFVEMIKMEIMIVITVAVIDVRLVEKCASHLVMNEMIGPSLRTKIIAVRVYFS